MYNLIGFVSIFILIVAFLFYGTAPEKQTFFYIQVDVTQIVSSIWLNLPYVVLHLILHKIGSIKSWRISPFLFGKQFLERKKTKFRDL